MRHSLGTLACLMVAGAACAQVFAPVVHYYERPGKAVPVDLLQIEFESGVRARIAALPPRLAKMGVDCDPLGYEKGSEEYYLLCVPRPNFNAEGFRGLLTELSNLPLSDSVDASVRLDDASGRKLPISERLKRFSTESAYSVREFKPPRSRKQVPIAAGAQLYLVAPMLEDRRTADGLDTFTVQFHPGDDWAGGRLSCRAQSRELPQVLTAEAMLATHKPLAEKASGASVIDTQSRNRLNALPRFGDMTLSWRERKQEHYLQVWTRMIGWQQHADKPVSGFTFIRCELETEDLETRIETIVNSRFGAQIPNEAASSIR